MRTRIAALSLAAALAAPALALAHGGHGHLLGTVAARDASRLTVQERDGKSVAVRVTPETRYFVGKKVASGAEATVGRRVLVDTEGKTGDLQAVEVRLGKAPAASPASAPAKAR